MLKIGHRGARGYAPENTLLSFRKALELGVDAVELDVYCCKSGETVVIHDDRVDRTTNGKGCVWEKTFGELRQLDAGEGEKIPSLEEVLDLINRKVLINIELKGEGAARSVAKIIKRYILEKNWKNENFLISSFNYHELVRFHKLLLSVRLGALITGIPIDYAKFGEDLKAYSVNLSREFVNQAFVDDAHRRGLKAFVWTVNEPEDIKRIKSLGVDGIFSDFPDRL